MKRPHILYIVTDDWFFVSHFMPMARAARDAGFRVSIAGRMDQKRPVLAAEGFETIDTVEGRKGGTFAALRSFFRLFGIMRKARPDLVHCIALRSILFGGLARKLSGGGATVLAATGLGFLATDRNEGWKRKAIYRLCRWLGSGARTSFLFENATDKEQLGLTESQRDQAVIVGGAGIDPDKLQPSPLPQTDALRLAFVARMIWSKGVDTAIAAVCDTRKKGAPVTLDLYGEPDPGNPASMDLQMLQTLDSNEGICWHGRTSDVAEVWARHHLCILPSRGGEGLPRTLLEAAACGRGIITTDVPGCRDFVRNGVEGTIVPPDDADALASAILRYAGNPELVAAAGAAARARVLQGYTEQAVSAAVLQLYRTLLT